jgi:hypothetical protein
MFHNCLRPLARGHFQNQLLGFHAAKNPPDAFEGTGLMVPAVCFSMCGLTMAPMVCSTP